MGGAWTKNAIKDSPDFDLVGIVDISEKALNETGETLALSVDKRFRSLEDALKVVQADAVLTVTPPVIHAQHARLAFEKGLHVLTEKPIGDTLENARLMVKWAEEAGKQLVVAQNYRFGAAIVHLRKLARENALGAFGHGHLDFYIPADFTGSFRETMEYPLLVDMAIHHIDLIRAVTGRNIVKLTALSFRPSWSWYQHDPGLKMLLEMDDGTAFSYSGDWSAKGRFTPWNGNWRLNFAEGSIHLEDDKLAVVTCEKWNKNMVITPEATPAVPYNGQQKLLADFAAAIRSGTPAETSGADNLWSFAAVMAGVTSAREKRSVSVAEMLK